MYRLKKVIHAFCFLGFLMAPPVCSGQFSDNFSDGNFSGNPEWMGSTSVFIVNASSQLQLNNTVAANSSLSSSFVSASLANYEWQVYVKQTFAPSGSNYGRVYLVSDQSNLGGPLNGYFLQFGEALSSDAVELFRQTGLTTVSVCRATTGAIATGSNLRVRVLRSEVGLWQVFIDYAGGTNFVLEASGIDAIHNSSAFAGVLCVYTASNANKFFFDDFYAGPEILDTTPPAISSIQSVSSTQLNVVFNEKVDATTSQSVTNYLVNNGVGAPSTAILQVDEKIVQLTFVQSFPNAVASQLTVSGVKDLFNNATAPVTQNFLFFQSAASQWKDIIITEIFADPSPSVGLPDAEFIELFNRSEKIFDLQNWEITDGSSAGVLPSHLIFPGDYVIITSVASTSQFISFGTVLSVSNFPTLNNSGDALELKDNTHVSVDKVHYSDTWFRDEDKKQGGCTLELIDPANPCAEEENWVATESIVGGTPGTQNSVFANKPDVTGPKLISAIPTSAKALTLLFNEKLNEQLSPTSSFTTTPPVSIASISFADASQKSLELVFDNNLLTSTTYKIQAQTIYDCNGNLIQSEFNDVHFGLPEQAAKSDLVLNEILFNPRPTGVDFLEVYNNSLKYINLKNWSVAHYENGVVFDAKPISKTDLLIAPNQYRVFTEAKNVLKGEYVLAEEQNLFDVSDLPSFNDDGGTIALIDSLNNVIDFFSYADYYHSVFINDDEGVSLERISFSELTNSASNWKSASSSVGFATPGYVNSNARTHEGAGKIMITPEAFEPVSGQPSFTQIQYNFQQGGFVANVKILDAQGREIKQLVNNATLGTEGFFRWDGDTNDGSKARIGYYVVWMEIFNDRGDVETFRKRVVVASRPD